MRFKKLEINEWVLCFVGYCDIRSMQKCKQKWGGNEENGGYFLCDI